MLMIALLIAMVWLAGTLTVVGVCRSAAYGDRTQIVPSWDDHPLVS